MQTRKTYLLTIDVEQEEDGRWGAEVLDFPGCAAWGYTREEALEALQDGAQAMLEMMLEYGDPIPAGIEKNAAAADVKSGVLAVTI